MIDWETVAKKLEYVSESEMWTDLYLKQELTFSELSARFGVSHTTVRDAIRRHKLPARPRGGAMRPPDPRWPEDEAFFAEVEKDGLCNVAERLGFSPSSVYKRARKLKRLRRDSLRTQS